MRSSVSTTQQLKIVLALTLIALASIGVRQWLPVAMAAEEDVGLSAKEARRTLVELVGRFREAPNVRFRIIALLSPSCATRACIAEGDEAIQQVQSILSDLERQEPSIKQAVERKRISILTDELTAPMLEARYRFELISDPIQEDATCPVQVMVNDQQRSPIVQVRNLRLVAGSQAILRPGTRVEVAAASVLEPVALSVSRGGSTNQKMKHSLGGDSLLLTFTRDPLHLSYSPDRAAVDQADASPRALGDIILGIQADGDSRKACEWNLLPGTP